MKTVETIWDVLYDDPIEAKQMKKWSRDKMMHEKLMKTCDEYIEQVYHNVETADTRDVLISTLELVYGEDILERLDQISMDKDAGLPFDPPVLVITDEAETVHTINPEGKPPMKSCKWCKDDGTDWRGIDTKNLIQRCGFCRDGGQDW
jgi:hypothetical protein